MKLSLRTNYLVLISLIIFISTSCRKTNPLEDNTDDISIEDLIIPDNFDFSTTKTFQISISDVEENVKYDIYSIKQKGIENIIYGETDTTLVLDILNQKIASGFVKRSGYINLITIPSYHKYLYLVRSIFRTDISSSSSNSI